MAIRVARVGTGNVGLLALERASGPAMGQDEQAHPGTCRTNGRNMVVINVDGRARASIAWTGPAMLPV